MTKDYDVAVIIAGQMRYGLALQFALQDITLVDYKAYV
jgi:hypothetical protein